MYYNGFFLICTQYFYTDRKFKLTSYLHPFCSIIAVYPFLQPVLFCGLSFSAACPLLRPALFCDQPAASSVGGLLPVLLAVSIMSSILPACRLPACRLPVLLVACRQFCWWPASSSVGGLPPAFLRPAGVDFPSNLFFSGFLAKMY